jgi:hypothetical protein
MLVSTLVAAFIAVMAIAFFFVDRYSSRHHHKKA